MKRADAAHMPCATLVGRADLFRCLDYYSAEKLAEAGPLFGFVHEKKDQPEKPVCRDVVAAFDTCTATVITRQPEPVVQFLRVKQCKSIKEDAQSINLPDWAQVPAPYTDDDLRADKSVEELKPMPLAPWKREWPFLRAACGKKVETTAIDYARLIKIIASRKVLRTIPRRKMLGWTHSCQILLDFDFRLYPFWGDMRRVAGELSAMRHKSGLQVLVFDSESLTSCRNFFDLKQKSFPYALPEPGSAVLVLSDLGLYADDEVLRQRWALLGKRLAKQGKKPIALLPCPPRLWTDDIDRYWSPVYWDRGVRLPDSESKIKRASKVPLPQDDAADRSTDLLTALSPAVLVEPALLRAVRSRVSGKRMDVGVEAEVWNHPHVKSCTLGFAVEPSQRQHYQKLFRDQQDTQTVVFEQIERHHAYLPRVIRFEETLNRHFLTGGEAPPAEEFLKKLFDALKSGEFKEQDGLDRYLHRMYERLSEECWAGNDRATALWLKLHIQELQQGKDILIPDRIDLGRFQWLFAKYRSAGRYVLVQQGPELWVDTEQNAVESEMGFSLFRFETVLPVVQLVAESGAIQRIPVDNPVSSSTLPETKRFDLRTESSVVTLEKITKPPWATGIGREGSDLFVTLPDKRTLHWFNPGRYEFRLNDRNAAIDIINGFWWDVTGFAGWGENIFGNLDWADDVGLDAYGVYADFSVGRVTQRLRWIWPGEFSMGSPGDEPEREDREKQHDVILSEGFWLAEAACTQALWQEVMGENPSKFKGENLPVETVSWEDCNRFIQSLNEKKPGLELRLPSEAQWEYACRAGTATTFSFGENITPKQVNYDGNYPYNNGPKGAFRGKTVAVKSLPCNNWGLYEMHGNVYEWCHDWHGDYPSEAVVNPAGPDTGSYRVLRGGGWFGSARFCRSVCRFHYEPGFRYADIGFRFSRGQKR